LKGDFDLIRSRLEARKNHYMKAGLLESQFAALEEPRDAVVVDVAQPPDALANQVLGELKIVPKRAAGFDQ
jgi:gluconokinase